MINLLKIKYYSAIHYQRSKIALENALTNSPVRGKIAESALIAFELPFAVKVDCRPQSALFTRRCFPMDFDQFDQTVNAEVGEGHDALLAEALDPDQPVFGLHFDGHVGEKPNIFAQLFGDQIDGSDMGDLVDVHGSGRRGAADRGRGRQFHDIIHWAMR